MKYNWSIIGHENQLEQIEQDIESGNLAHAYLLAGPNSVGKLTVARKMAGILQCNNDFCHKCPTCIQVSHHNQMDTVEIKGKDSIKIDEVRSLIDRINMTGQSNYKIFIIQSIERMTIQAANSFLKALEEPPDRTLYILTTNNIRSLLPTIVSRVRTVTFGNVSTSYLEKKLRELYPNEDEDTIKQVALFSLGKTGKAIHLIESPASLAQLVEVYHDVQNFLTSRSVVDRFSYVNDIVEDPAQIESFFNILSHVLRSKLLEGDNSEKNINTLSKIEEAGILLKQNINPRLVLENLMLSL